MEDIPVQTVCGAPPYPGAGVECVDLEDAGISRLTPLEVDKDCNNAHGPACIHGADVAQLQRASLWRDRVFDSNSGERKLE